MKNQETRKIAEKILDKHIINRFDEVDKETFVNAMVEFANKQSQWISIKDRLPNYGIRVLLSIINARLKNVVCEGYFDYSNDPGVFKYTGGTSIKINAVTHWMPLPKPQKNEK